jgi:hypothetical protein
VSAGVAPLCGVGSITTLLNSNIAPNIMLLSFKVACPTNKMSGSYHGNAHPSIDIATNL